MRLVLGAVPPDDTTEGLDCPESLAAAGPVEADTQFTEKQLDRKVRKVIEDTQGSFVRRMRDLQYHQAHAEQLGVIPSSKVTRHDTQFTEKQLDEYIVGLADKCADVAAQ